MKNRTVCFCNEVGEREIVNAIKRKGARTVDDVKKLTRAGKDCGRCKPVTQSILDREIPLLPIDTSQMKMF